MIGERVLGADVLGDLGGDRVDLFERFREVGHTARLFGQRFEHAARVACLVLVGVAAEEQTDAVDGRAIKVLDTSDGSLEGGAGGVVFAVRHNEEHLLGLLGVLREVVGGCNQRVVDRRSPARLDVAEPLLELCGVAGEVLVDERFPGEVHQEGLVRWIRQLHEIEGGLVDGRALIVHGPGAVDQDAKRDGKIFVPEGGQGLWHTVFVDVKRVLREVQDGTPGAVEDCRVQTNFVGLLTKRIFAAWTFGDVSRCVGGRLVSRLCGAGRRIGIRRRDGIAVDRKRWLRGGLLGCLPMNGRRDHKTGSP